MSKEQETLLTEVTENIGSALGVVAAEAGKIVRPLTETLPKRWPAHSPARNTRDKNKKRTGTSGRPSKSNQSMRKRTGHAG